jgi:two-component system response regulator AtoC
LNVVPIRVPPLRERPEDIEPLVRAFVRTYSERYGMDQVHVEPALIDAFKAYSWPGNVREVENTVARLLALTADDRLTLALWRSLTEETRQSGPVSLIPSSGTGDPGPGHPLRARVESFERAIISAEFVAANKNQSETARRLGVSRPALIEKLHKYELIGPERARS